MFVTPASFAGFGQRLTHDAAARLARNWPTLLLNGIVLVIAGVLIFSIDWSVTSLSTFIGALFIFEGVWAFLTVGIDNRAANLVTGALSAAAGIAIIAWPSPSLIVLGIFLGAWLIVLGTITISGAFRGSPSPSRLVAAAPARAGRGAARHPRPGQSRRDAGGDHHRRRTLGRRHRSDADRLCVRAPAPAGVRRRRVRRPRRQRRGRRLRVRAVRPSSELTAGPRPPCMS
jgi:Short repeat of unknown function (DUF308)